MRAIRIVLSVAVLLTLFPHTVKEIHAVPKIQIEQFVEVFSGGQFASDLPDYELGYDEYQTLEVDYYYDGGGVCLSGMPSSCTQTAADDAIKYHFNNQSESFYESGTENFGPIYFDESQLNLGWNTFTLTIVDFQGPYVGGSPMYLVPTNAKPTNQLEITGIQQIAGSVVYMNSYYTHKVTIHNPSSMTQSGVIKSSEVLHSSDGTDPTGITLEQYVSISAGESKTIEFSYSHWWNWLYEDSYLDNNCNMQLLSLVSILKNAAPGVILPATGAGEFVGNVFGSYGLTSDFNDAIENTFWSNRLRVYNHTYSIQTDDYVTEQVAIDPIIVEVQPNKSADLGIASASAMSFGVLAGLLVKYGYNPATLANVRALWFLTGMTGSAYFLACNRMASAIDPDNNYQSIVQPQINTIPLLNDLSGIDKRYMELWLELIGYDDAHLKTMGKYEGARLANDDYWMEQQARHARKLNAHMLYLGYALELLYQGASIDSATLSEADLDAILNQYSNNGLPEELVKLLNQIGYSESEIGELPAILLDVWQDRQGYSIEQLITPMDMLGRGISASYWSITEELKNVTSSSLDVTQPTTIVRLEGTIGNNDWYVSTVNLNVSATDNPEGSGVNKILYSVDGGLSWNVYNDVITLETGVYDFLAYSIDNEGNIEFPPYYSHIQVDYTPPQTSAYATGPLDINQMFRDDVTASLASTDNLSGVDYVEYSIDNGITWQHFYTDTVEFPFKGNGISQFYFRATDIAGNIETTKDSGPIVINRYAVFGDNSATAVEFDRSTSILIDGDVHANGYAQFINNTDVTIDGALTTQRGVNSNGNTSLTIPSPTSGVHIDMLNYPKAYFTQNADVVHSGNLTMYDTSTVISGTMYVQGDLTIYGTTVAGDGVVVVDGNIYDYSTEWNVESNDSGTGVVLYSSGNIELYGTSNYAIGMMYAPNGTITVHSSDLNMNGSLVANRVYFDRATSGQVSYNAVFESGTYTLPLTSAVTEPGIAVISSDSGELYDSMEPNVYFGRAYGVTQVEQSMLYASEGTKSLEVTTNGSYGHFTRWIGGQDWSNCPTYEVHVVNPSDSRARVAMVATRSGSWHQTGGQTVPPQSAAILIYDLSTLSGMHNVTSFGFIVDNDPAKELYFDNFRRICSDPNQINVIPSTNGELYESFEESVGWWGKSQGVSSIQVMSEYASHGNDSLKVTSNGGWGNINRWIGGQDWSNVSSIEVHVVNPTDSQGKVMLMLTRSQGGWYQSGNKHIPPHSAVILNYDVGSISGLASVTSIGFIVDTGSANELYFDNIRRISTGAGASSDQIDETQSEQIYLPLINR